MPSAEYSEATVLCSFELFAVIAVCLSLEESSEGNPTNSKPLQVCLFLLARCLSLCLVENMENFMWQ
jgi:hypothetical protein